VFTYAATPYPTNVSQGLPPQPSLSFMNVRLKSGSCVYPKQDQTISFTAPSGLSYGSPATDLGATATSGLPVSYSSSTPAVCAIDSSTRLQVVAAGTCAVTAAQAGDDHFNPAAPVTRQFAIDPALLLVNADEQETTYGEAPPPLTFTLSGFAPNEDAASASVTGTASCALAGAAGPDTGIYSGAISCAPGPLAAPNYVFARGASADFTILEATQTIAFDQPADIRVNDPDAELAATATSGVPVSFGSSTPESCTIVQGKLHAVTAGSCAITASQSGDANHEPANPVTRTLASSPAQPQPRPSSRARRTRASSTLRSPSSPPSTLRPGRPRGRSSGGSTASTSAHLSHSARTARRPTPPRHCR